MRLRQGYDSLLNRISSDMCENATETHRIELAQLGLRSATARRFQAMLADVKDRLARKGSSVTQLVYADRSFELPNKAA